ncbi:prolyl oligopeptidase family serine peptidase [Polaribacter batillariae]|uniref:Prolyl oligopeptidase family serine peptidase n=1 Tax=Polaribacter batillariae TaxID=2808900 RepID=A0ABX7SWW5_9FLAO|nr:GDSL-type esterase/lipase family protein [Polaribacter batillariae]QTD38740.1 prolyl oligopeptidase family serine peptidase [Polaribacter batillariae]
MKFVLKVFLGIILIFTSCKPAKQPIKIACIGDSITYGAGMDNREKNAYPNQLQEMLGNNYQVKNFGVNGNTLLKKGDYPYWKSNTYQEALSFAPDVVYIKLGTNDSKQQNRIYLDSNFEKDYKALIQSFKEKNNQVRVVLLLPVPSFLNDSTSIWNPIIKNKIIPLTQKVAYDTKSEVVDLYQLFASDQNMFPDKIHPSSLGATRIARRVYEDVIFKAEDSSLQLDTSKLSENKTSIFHGFKQTDFKYKNIPCKIVSPKRVAKGKPWVLRARFFGHEPQTDIALLERGFYIAYCDVAGFYGNKDAVNRWNFFYDFMVKNGFSNKVVLEGMSRGGLIVYNWAVENPEKVACIYADAPVLDGTSWPGGKGKGVGSKADWNKFKKMYHISSEDKMADFKGNPIHKTNAIAKGNFPMFHVCGVADKVVPVDENTRIFEQKIKEAGGNIDVIYKEGVGHHPHSLKNPSPIVNFILRATRKKVNFATIPAPGSEYRSGAGWVAGKGWWYQMEDINNLSQSTKDLDILFIGNSITQGWGGNRNFTTYKPGKAAANTYFKEINYVNAGISGDRTEHILWRISNGNYNTNSPKLITLAIGVNNFRFNTADEISKGIVKIVELMENEFPNSQIVLLGPLPVGLNAHSLRRQKYNKIHKAIAYLNKKPQINYYNLIDWFSDENGNLKENLYNADGIHLKPEGYQIWGKFIKEKYNELIKNKNNTIESKKKPKTRSTITKP